jgi:hypothetical protein
MDEVPLNYALCEGAYLLEKMSKKWIRVIPQPQFTDNQGCRIYCKRWKAPKHWYYPYSERNEIRIGGGVKDGEE